MTNDKKGIHFHSIGGKPNCVVGHAVCFLHTNIVLMQCVSHREHGEINIYRLTLVPGGCVRANLLAKDLGSEQLIPPDGTRKAPSSAPCKYVAPSSCPSCFPLLPPRGYKERHLFSVSS